MNPHSRSPKDFETIKQHQASFLKENVLGIAYPKLMDKKPEENDIAKFMRVDHHVQKSDAGSFNISPITPELLIKGVLHLPLSEQKKIVLLILSIISHRGGSDK